MYKDSQYYEIKLENNVIKGEIIKADQKTLTIDITTFEPACIATGPITITKSSVRDIKPITSPNQETVYLRVNIEANCVKGLEEYYSRQADNWISKIEYHKLQFDSNTTKHDAVKKYLDRYVSYWGKFEFATEDEYNKNTQNSEYDQFLTEYPSDGASILKLLNYAGIEDRFTIPIAKQMISLDNYTKKKLSDAIGHILTD